MKTKPLHIAVINAEDSIIFAKAYPAKQKAESAIVKYLNESEGFKGKNFTEACSWIAEKDLKLDLMVFEIDSRDFIGIQLNTGYTVMPPPKEKNLYRAVYTIDVLGTDKLDAAQQAWKIMRADDAAAPVLTLMDSKGDYTTLDLQDVLEFNKITPGFVTQRFRKSDGNQFECVWQEFTAGDDVQFENLDGEQIEIPEHAYQTYDMVKPIPPK